MLLTRLAVLATLAVALPTQSAVAQTLTNGTSAGGGTVLWAASGAASALNMSADTTLLGNTDPAPPVTIGNVSWNILPDLSAAVAEEEQAAARTLPTRGYFIRAFGGLVAGSGTGVSVGGGISALPFSDKRHEVTGNAEFLRIEGSNGFGIFANYQYNFRLQGGQRFTPYAGGGVHFTHFGCGVPDEFEEFFGPIDCGSNQTDLQLGGGLRWPWSNGREFALEVWLTFFYSNPVWILGVLTL